MQLPNKLTTGLVLAQGYVRVEFASLDLLVDAAGRAAALTLLVREDTVRIISKFADVKNSGGRFAGSFRNAMTNS